MNLDPRLRKATKTNRDTESEHRGRNFTDVESTTQEENPADLKDQLPASSLGRKVKRKFVCLSVLLNYFVAGLV